jgi:hypothetical protein
VSTTDDSNDAVEPSPASRRSTGATTTAERLAARLRGDESDLFLAFTRQLVRSTQYRVNTSPDIVDGNDVDEDCLDRPAPFPGLPSTIGASWRFSPFAFRKLYVSKAMAGSRIKLRCRGDDCPFQSKLIRVRRDRKKLSILGRLANATLKRGDVVVVRVTKPTHDGVMRKYIVRGADRDPKSTSWCLPAAGGRPRAC